MTLDAFLNIDGIPGESLDDQYKDWIEITGYSFGTYQSASVTAVRRAEQPTGGHLKGHSPQHP
ncbi:type VI secretion system tube protein Hcp [Pseudomonas sp. F3-2]|uniref:type VI secretion system tube protein Hcp n=1 Tax=Pseudomonas sp. F3-2 TaxID=3141539 RepID=UPI00315CF235